MITSPVGWYRCKKRGYSEPVFIPKVEREVVHTAIQAAVKERQLWLVADQASLLAEDVPEEVLTQSAHLHLPPAPINASAIMPDNLPEVWNNEVITVHDIADEHSFTLGYLARNARQSFQCQVARTNA